LMYVVVRCPRCSGFLLGKTAQKTRSCPHCGHRATLSGLRVLARTDSSREAVTLIQALKEKEAAAREGD
jgi:DNA-directed RNA polymerase subunit RPC12/RpoP